ncbi:inorganic phosphate transporter [bacterium]|nr:inorganic phosphate transporter [candidate division CSSED10-310 bacterium]
MGPEIITIAAGLLFTFAIFDLTVGVSNDAVNFLNSSIGSKAAPRYVIMLVASLGILMGVTFSSGMMEIARKGVFHPQYFIMPELLILFLAVMISDIILLDLFNTFGLPTSTTVSVVFELLGSAVAVSLWKIRQQGSSLLMLGQYINTSKAMTMIFGILLSIIVAFICGSVIQFFSRTLFTFDYRTRLMRYGALWGGVALSLITYFILIKGASGSVFITPESIEWIKTHTMTILLMLFGISAVILQILVIFKINIFKLIVLVGTFAIAMSFAANDLVNFIGVPLAGFQAIKLARLTPDPMLAGMEQLGSAVQTDWYILLGAGAVMVITLWLSRKARTVSRTEISLSSQSESYEQTDSMFLARTIVRMFISFYGTVKAILPSPLTRYVAHRFDPKLDHMSDPDKQGSFDLLRASVNLMVASAVISYATSNKLPLSTTYVTFMVAMGSSFADRAWGRESAVYRITGVLTVIGGWFLTALLASTFAFTFATILFHLKITGLLVILLLGAFVLWRNHRHHAKRESAIEETRVFNLRHVSNVKEIVPTTFVQMGYLLFEIRHSLDNTLDALFTQQEWDLNEERRKVRRYQTWANVIIANIFKALRLLQMESALNSYQYSQTVRCLQKLTDGHRDIIARAHKHVSNQHKGLLPEQVEDLRRVKTLIHDVLQDVELAFKNKSELLYDHQFEKDAELRELARQLNERQTQRISSGASKTRLSILFFAIMGNILMISKQNLRLLEIFKKSFKNIDISEDPDVE